MRRRSLPGGIAARRRRPMTSAMDVAADDPRKQRPVELLLRHCLALGGIGRERRSPQIRLEEAVGPELTRRLLATITVSQRR